MNHENAETAEKAGRTAKRIAMIGGGTSAAMASLLKPPR